jgi:hypothetical protein
MAKAQQAQALELPPINIKQFRIRLVGDSPLIVHAWSHKAKEQMLAKQMKRAKQGRVAKDPLADYADSLYWLSERPEVLTPESIAEGRFGFPVVGIKSAAVSAARWADGVKMTELRGAFHLQGEMAAIEGTPRMREDTVRVGMGTADLRYRAEFPEWSMEVAIRYNANVISPEQIANLLNIAGFGVGLGEWRAEKDGSFGLFHVE